MLKATSASMLRHAALRLRPVGARLARPAASRQNWAARGPEPPRRIATARPRPLTLPQCRAPKLLPRACAPPPRGRSRQRPPPLEEEEKAPASASERAQAFISNLTVADAARYGTYAAGGSGYTWLAKACWARSTRCCTCRPRRSRSTGFTPGFWWRRRRPSRSVARCVEIKRRCPAESWTSTPSTRRQLDGVAVCTRLTLDFHTGQAWLAIHIRPEFPGGPRDDRRSPGRHRPPGARRPRRRCRCAPTIWTGATSSPAGRSACSGSRRGWS